MKKATLEELKWFLEKHVGDGSKIDTMVLAVTTNNNKIEMITFGNNLTKIGLAGVLQNDAYQRLLNGIGE